MGHTEGAIDLMKCAGLKPAAVLSEVMNEDGTMANGKTLDFFSKTHHIPMVTIEDLIHYRLQHENLIDASADAHLPLEEYGDFKITVIKEKINNLEHIVLTNDAIRSTKPLLVRIHSACMTGDLFSSSRCDCHQQLHYALKRISKEGGILIYLNQEGRGIGLLNKIKAYHLQEQGYDTVEANQKLALPIDARKYYLAASLLKEKQIYTIRLLTNNPDKVNGLKQFGITQIEQITLPTFCNPHNHHYLTTKQKKLNHSIQIDKEEIKVCQ